MKIFLILIYVVSGIDCSELRLIGGGAANKKHWKFYVVFSCGRLVRGSGSLIRPKWALTAAHCVHGEAVDTLEKYFGHLNVRIGSDDVEVADIQEVLLPGKNKDLICRFLKTNFQIRS